jgi:hypothetical protein
VGVSYTDVFLWGSSRSFIDVIYVLLACRYMIASAPCLCSLYLGEVLCLMCGDCETDVRGEHTFLYITALHTTKKTSIPICERCRRMQTIKRPNS